MVFEYLAGPKNQAADWLSRSVYVPRENRPVVTIWDCMSGMGTVLRGLERCSALIEPHYTVRYLATDTSKYAQQATADVASRVLAAHPNLLLKSPPDIYVKKPRGGKKPPALHDLRQIVAAWKQYPSSVPFVDFASFGTPCQPWSRAGAHKGFKDERDLFPAVLEAIAILQKKNKDLLFMVECTLFHPKLQKELTEITESFKNLGARRELHDLKYVIPSNRQRYTWTNIESEPRTRRCDGWQSWSDCLDDATAPREIAPCVMARQATRSERSKQGEVPAAFVTCSKTGNPRPMTMEERERVQGAHPGDCQIPKAPVSVHQSLLGNSFPVVLVEDKLRHALQTITGRMAAVSKFARLSSTPVVSTGDADADTSVPSFYDAYNFYSAQTTTVGTFAPPLDDFVKRVKDLPQTDHYKQSFRDAETRPGQSRFCIEHGVLWRWVNRERNQKALYIPDGRTPEHRQVQHAAVHAAHDCVNTGAHAGFDKTAAWFDSSFYWPRAREYLFEYVKSCPQCQLFSPYTGRTSADLHSLDVPKAPGVALAADWVSGLPKAQDAHDSECDCVWVWTDRFSKRTLYVPMTLRMKSESYLRNLFLTEVLPFFGVPNEILADRDTKLVTSRNGMDKLSPFAAYVQKTFGVVWRFASSKHHQTNGAAEAQVKNLVSYLSKSLSDADSARTPTLLAQYSEWPVAVKILQTTYNNSRHSVTKVSPEQLWKGRDDNHPWSQPDDCDALDTLEHQAQLSSHTQALWESARAGIHNSQAAAAKAHNSRFKTDALRYHPGQYVKVLDFRSRDPSTQVVHQYGKFRPRYVGPLKVTDATDTNVWVDWSTSLP